MLVKQSGMLYTALMTDTNTDFDFGDIEGQAVERLRAKKVEPVPDSVIKLAQLSRTGVPHPNYPDRTLHVRRHQFKPGEEAKRDAFVKHMRNAGPHVTPPGSVTVVTDPERKGNHLLVAWNAGEPRGRKTT